MNRDYVEMLNELSAAGAEYLAIGAYNPHMSARRNVTVRKYKMGEEPLVDDSERAMTPGERVNAVWEISKSLWAWKSRTFDEPEFRRDVTRVVRRGR